MTDSERKALRTKYIAEYLELTGENLLCIEKKRGLSYYKNSAKRNIVKLTAEFFNIPHDRLVGGFKTVEDVKARQFISYLLDEMKVTKVETSKVLNQNHASVINAINRVKGYISVDEDYQKEYNDYKEHCLKHLKPLPKSCTKLTPEQVKAIQYSLNKGGITQKELAEIYNVGERTIRKAFKNKYYTCT